MAEAKVTVHARRAAEAPTGAAETAAAMPETRVVEDGRGRAIELRKPSVLAQFRLVKILDPETAKNEKYVQMIFPLLFVVRIDGEPVGFPQSEREVEALIARLDHDGLAAVVDGVRKHWDAPAAEDRERTKN
ncbi:MAG: hypothetical protein ACREEW_12775 [Caulobacteraceae bacterium]